MKIHELFWEELKIIKKLRHPNIVTCFEYFRTVNNCYSIYEYCEEGDLSHLLKKGPFKDKDQLAQVNRIIRDVYRGLLYL
jgi:serine/threonine protein kinase